MKNNHKIILLITLILSYNAMSAVDNLSSEELLIAQKQGVVIIDIRTPEEWREGTIANASKIMFFNQQRKPLVNEFMSEFQKVVTSKDQAFVLVCRTGSRTGAVTKFLNEKLGYSKAAHLEKGMKQWMSEKRYVDKNK